MQRSSFKREMVKRLDVMKVRDARRAPRARPRPRFASDDGEARAKVTYYDRWLEDLTRFEGQRAPPARAAVQKNYKRWVSDVLQSKKTKYQGLRVSREN